MNDTSVVEVSQHPDRHLLKDALIAISVGGGVLAGLVISVGLDQWMVISLSGFITFAGASSCAFVLIHGIRWASYSHRVALRITMASIIAGLVWFIIIWFGLMKTMPQPTNFDEFVATLYTFGEHLVYPFCLIAAGFLVHFSLVKNAPTQ